MYTVLDENLMVKGRLSLNNGQGSTSFFGDTITTQLATDNANDPTNLTTNDYTNQDKQGNAKQWSHSLTISVESTDLGTSITTNDYLMYFDDVVNHYYLMKVLGSDTDRSSGYITATAINAAIYELGKQLIQTEQTLSQVDLKTFVTKMYKNAPFSLQIADNNLTTVDYTISANTSLQALLQDLQTKFNVDVDSWVEVDNTGHITDRVLYFGNRGRDNGELIRYGGAKGFEAMTATEVSDIIYTKLYVTGKTDDKDTTKGHIGTVNNGLEYIVDDEANQKLYAIGASQQQPVYLEGAITNNLLSEPQALLDWAKEQMAIFNHPRFNYTVTPLHDQNVALGDIITVQDFHVKPEILVTSKVIQKTTSFASPETNTFVLGEFSSIFTDNMNKGANVITLIKKDVTVVQEAADIAKAQADAAYQQAVTAQEKAIHAQTSADGKTTIYTADSVQDLPQNANEGDIGWVKLSDGTHMYSYTDGKWVEKINPSMGADIDKKVLDVVTQAKDYSDKAIADNQVKIDESIKSVDDKANQLKQDQSGLDAKAQDYANQAKIDAITNTTQAVKETLDNSQKALDQAKTDLTNGIAKETADRQSAVNALDTKAQGYANQAKSDAISAATTADGVINKKIDDTASSITTTISQNKTDANGKIATAQSMAQQAVDGLTLKVSKTDYDQKTGDLSTKINDVKETADKSAQTIADIKTADGKQDARMSEIENTASGLKSTVSDISTEQGKQSGYISTLQQRADGFDATVTKVDNLSVGGRNLILGTETDITWTSDSTNNYSFNVIATGLKPDQTYTFSAEVTLGNTDQKNTTLSLYDAPIGQWLGSTDHFKADGTRDHWTFTVPSNVNTPTASLIIYAGTPGSTGGKSATFHHIKLETGNIPTDYTPAPEDTDSKFSQQQQTIDRINSTVQQQGTNINNVSTRVQTAEGNISTAQNNISGLQSKQTQTANGLSQEVSDRKSGDNNTLQQGKDFTTSQISNSESGMKSFVNQTISGLQIGAISSDVNALKSSTQWQTVNVDDLNNMTNQGKFFIQGGNHTNTPVGGWFYLTVDKPINGRITQVAWADSNPTMQYTRILFGSNWSNWNRVVTNETVLSIFNDSWSLGTSANDGITKKLITGINGQADGTLVVSGKSIVLNSQTVKGNDFIIGSANIANGAIGTAQIGDAAITSAKIASLDARKITTGQLLGSNMNIDLDSGEVFFQKGRIYDSKTQIDININQAYIRTTNGGGSATLQNGRLLLTGPVYNNGQTIDSNPYFSVSASLLPTNSNQPDGAVGSLIQSKDFSEISVSGHGSIGFLSNIAAERGAGIGISAVTGTYIAGNDQGVILSGGKNIGGVIFAESPNLVVGYDDSKGVDGKDVGGNSILARANNFVIAANNFSIDKNGNGKVSNGFFARNIGTNGYHTITSQDGGRVYFSDGNNNSIDISVKTVSQSSLVSLKENIRDIDPEYALSEVLKSDVKQYNFIGESKDNIRVSPMIDDVNHELYIPKDWLAEDGKSVENYTITGYLIQSIKALQQEIKELKQG